MSTFIRDPSRPRWTIRDVAADAGVSTATVSRVLNDSGYVAAETRAIVLQALERRGLAARRRRPRARPSQDVVAVRCPYLLTDYFGIIVSALAKSLRQRGKDILLSVEAEEGNEPSLSQLLRPGTSDGAILVLPPEPGEMLAELRASELPFVVLDPRTTLASDIAAVSAAHFSGGRMATEHLINLGHTKVAAIAGPLNWIATDGRLMGYRAALAATGRLAPPEYVSVAGEPTIDHGREAAHALLSLAHRPTAIVAFNDKIAIGTMEVAAELGLRVPDDLSLVGFDDIDLSRVVRPQLTTVRQPLEEMARLGVELLIRLIEGREIHTLHIELATELVVRNSTAPPAS